MGRTLKAGKASAGAAQQKRRKKTGLGGGGSSPALSVASSGGNSTPGQGKECDKCGNNVLLEGVAKAWPVGKKSVVSTGCQICDFVAFRRSQRPCVECSRTGCDHFCEWCGKGFHAKCAKLRSEDVGNPNGFCCRKCEAEQNEGHETDEEEAKTQESDEEDVGSRCGSCRLPFASSGKETEDAKVPIGFKVNQAVLVDNEDVLYNALITEVDTREERIKIHFTRWSKSFDDWYAMDDEHINESLACDCCNQWFHIGCLPPIKSSGRWKDSTYVCPRCIDDARAFHNGSRLVLKEKAAYISTSKAICANARAVKKVTSPKESETVTIAVAKTKKPSKAPVVVDDDDEDMEETKENEAKANTMSGKKKRKLSEATDVIVEKEVNPSENSAESKSTGTQNSGVYVKMEQKNSKFPLYPRTMPTAKMLNQPAQPAASVRKDASTATKTSKATTNRGTKRGQPGAGKGSSLSAFDILREVAAQSIGGDIDDNAAPVKPKREKRAPVGRTNNANKRTKMDAAVGSSNSTASPGTNVNHGAEIDRSPQTRDRIQMNSFVDLHFSIRKEMYLRFCRLEEEGMLTRDSAHVLRSLIYPTSERFQDLKFVYLVNKDLPSVQLTKRLLEAVPYPPAVAKPLNSGVPHANSALRPPMDGKGLAGLPISMGMFSAGMNRNSSPAGMSLLPPPPGSTLLRPEPPRPDQSSRIASGTGNAPPRANANVTVSAAPAPAKRPEMLLMEQLAPAHRPVSNQQQQQQQQQRVLNSR
ncbi:hypothetical protein BBO99_00006037 [Phytophthora kernoviae]|uniref:Zinc finger PHD-type domain-containing protein n=2 Tax=Phytophthora kernoviae TaxID=325452 RepID=A0A3R7KT14_9STRA|nr:hypothetical protein G195_005906 [Phytophthora kernoviae 00238/432]KAG2525730.1 hypothetical protein JM18_004737 [Phytophthora kernoviae]RLN32119.1 hypothetical protein BBI17_006124 [Phytophthora kernoviae]RLN78303.1 hypothetical protein BBO99_00006037 [Phytophthora kernoviae]